MQMSQQDDETALDDVQDLGSLPFHVGVFDRPSNPSGIPDVLPFRVGVRRKDGLLFQLANQDVEAYLARAYATGHLLGTAMDDTDIGSRYADDFLAFIRETVPDLEGIRVLEIGCGRGYLLKLMAEAGAKAIGIEPGVGLRDYWQAYGVDVVDDTFPSSRVTGTFDLILAYGVLEHVAEPDAFIGALRNQLAPGGKALLSVPDCGEFLANNDPAMFVHEHYSYFSAVSLTAFLQANGLQVLKVRKAGFGGAIYCAWQDDPSVTSRDAQDDIATEPVSSQIADFASWRRFIEQQVEALSVQGLKLGVYCPGRALSVLPLGAQYRFFDDDRELHGRYYPPFDVPVESRDTLIETPVDRLWIYSRTFGPRLAEALRQVPALSGTLIETLADLTARYQQQGAALGST